MNLKSSSNNNNQVIWHWCPGVKYFNRKFSSRNVENWGTIEVITELDCIKSCAGDEQFEIGTSSSNILEQTEKNVYIGGLFMCLIHHYYTVADENRLFAKLLTEFSPFPRLTEDGSAAGPPGSQRRQQRGGCSPRSDAFSPTEASSNRENDGDRETPAVEDDPTAVANSPEEARGGISAAALQIQLGVLIWGKCEMMKKEADGFDGNENM